MLVNHKKTKAMISTLAILDFMPNIKLGSDEPEVVYKSSSLVST